MDIFGQTLHTNRFQLNKVHLIKEREITQITAGIPKCWSHTKKRANFLSSILLCLFLVLMVFFFFLFLSKQSHFLHAKGRSTSNRLHVRCNLIWLSHVWYGRINIFRFGSNIENPKVYGMSNFCLFDHLIAIARNCACVLCLSLASNGAWDKWVLRFGLVPFCVLDVDFSW